MMLNVESEIEPVEEVTPITPGVAPEVTPETQVEAGEEVKPEEEPSVN